MHDIRPKDYAKKGTKKKHFDKENQQRKGIMHIGNQIDPY